MSAVCVLITAGPSTKLRVVIVAVCLLAAPRGARGRPRRGNPKIGGFEFPRRTGLGVARSARWSTHQRLGRCCVSCRQSEDWSSEGKCDGSPCLRRNDGFLLFPHVPAIDGVLLGFHSSHHIRLSNFFLSLHEAAARACKVWRAIHLLLTILLLFVYLGEDGGQVARASIAALKQQLASLGPEVRTSVKRDLIHSQPKETYYQWHTFITMPLQWLR